MANDTFQILGVLAIPYLLAICMPSLRWLGRALAVVTGFLIIVVAYQWAFARGPDHELSQGQHVNAFLAMLATIPFAVGVLVRSVTLWVATKGLHRSAVITIGLLGYGLVPTVLYIPEGWRAWQMREPSEACQRAVFDVAVANARFALPAARVFDIEADERYQLRWRPSLRALCSHTGNGRRRLAARTVTIDLRGFAHSGDHVCAATAVSTDRDACKAIAAFVAGADRPSRILVGMLPPADDWDRFRTDTPLAPPTGMTSSMTTPDGTSLAFDCRPERESQRCHVRYPWRDGTWLAYTFAAGVGDVIAQGTAIDGAVRRLLDALAKP